VKETGGGAPGIRHRAEPCVGTKDTACVAACPVDCNHPKKNATHGDVRPSFDEVSQRYFALK
jgi:NAD-dependent dihydropyrimidine dehydrogenase PreA subunit